MEDDELEERALISFHKLFEQSRLFFSSGRIYQFQFPLSHQSLPVKDIQSLSSLHIFPTISQP